MPYQQFTQLGLQLLAEAAATDEIVIDRVFLSEEYRHPDTVDDYADDPDEFDGQFGSADVIGTVLSAGVADTTGSNKARIVVNLKLADNVTEFRDIRTVVISAHHKPVGDSAREEVLFCATYFEEPEDAPLTLFPVDASISKIPRTIDVAFEFAFENDSHVTVSSDTANHYLLADEMSRFVTAHSAESSVVGNDQDIYGKKTFKDAVVFDTSAPAVEFKDGLVVWPDVVMRASRIVPSGIDGYMDDGTIDITTENGLSINGPTTCQDLTATTLDVGDADYATATISYDPDNDELHVSSLFQADGIVHTPLPNVGASAQAASLNKADVGAIVLLYIKSQYSSTETIKPGQMLKPTASTSYSLGFAQMGVSGTGAVTCSLYNSTTEVDIGTYRALSACSLPANGSGFVLAMRVA